LEDAEAIGNLKARYAALCDAQYDADGIAMLFTEDALWESPGLGRFEGREAIRGFFRGASGIFSFAIDYSLYGQIEVEGDTAQARWYLFMPCTPPEIRRCGVPASITRLTQGDGAWMFRLIVPWEVCLRSLDFPGLPWFPKSALCSCCSSCTDRSESARRVGASPPRRPDTMTRWRR
jgi:hypothetical protein